MNLRGTNRNDKLIGRTGADSLIGYGGNDTLDGGTGADVMAGGTGNDTYVVDQIGDVLREIAGEGVDTVRASISYTLGMALENLALNGTGNLSGTGNSFANSITGNVGANRLAGGAGNDSLSGGAGTDTLLGGEGKDLLTGGDGRDLFTFGMTGAGGFDSGLGPQHDRIADFVSGQDRLDLADWFGGQGFAFVGTAAFTPSLGGAVRLAVQNGTTVLQADVERPGHVADGIVDAEIELTGLAGLTLIDLVGATSPATPPVVQGKPVGAISVPVGADLQAMVGSAAEGAVFWLEPGVHLASVTPKANQQFIGAEGAVLSGAKLLSGFTQSGSDWYIGGQVQQGEVRASSEGLPGFSQAGHPDAVFLNNVPLIQVGSRAELAPGHFYFDYQADRIYLRDNPAGKTVEAAILPYAFEGGATGVTIQHLTIEKYATPIQYGAIGGDHAPIGWTIADNEVQLNYGVGIIAGSGSKITGNVVHHNGEMGIGGNGAGIQVIGNEIAHNGYFSGIDPYWEGGGTKFAETTGLVVRGNYSHDNNGYGLWTDINNINTLYENNRIEYNSGGGINHEISYDAVIRDNSFVGNGSPDSVWLWGAAIQIQNSQNVDVYGNTIDMRSAGNGIVVIQQDRGTGSHGTWLSLHNSVHDNVLASDSDVTGNSGIIADYDEAGLLAGGNTFDRNDYHLTNAADDHWVWGDFYGWAAFKAASGQEAHGTFAIA